MWEAVREGIDDHRYVHLLWQMAAAANASNQPEAKKAAGEAEQALVRILGQIGWGFQALRSDDRTPPPHPSALRKWRSQVVQHILALLPHAHPPTRPHAHTLTLPPASRPSALDLPWAVAEKQETQYGADLFAPSDFETDLKPWRIEVWNKGVGATKPDSGLDANERHGGKQSARVQIPADAGSNATTVLVWPTWGGGGLNLALDGDRSYEFSAWVKSKRLDAETRIEVKDRLTLPELRISLPAGAAKTTTGKDKLTPDGWQRIWLRADMAFRAEPKYLAAWVQGPGTVWLDDLSLREVIPPPLSLTLDQTAYDRMDKLAVATVTLAKRLTPARLRFTLSPPGGKPIAEMTAPFQSSALKQDGPLALVAPASFSPCRLIFDPSALSPGNYAVKVDLLDGHGATLSGKSVPFQRDVDG
ncbi:MAG: hypothetical protein FJ279_36415 [Planctomycetes bacterium]|nr:hypothetical protein [Planctomycetota bacterium]